jgi:hypothetical protein
MNLNRSTWLIILGCTGGAIILFCAGCFFVGILAFLLSGDTSTSTSRDREPPTPRADRPFRVGQDVTVAEVRWRVLEAVDLGNMLAAPNEFQQPLSTSGRFIKVRFEVENLGSSQTSYGGVELIDQRDRRFENSSDAFPWIDDNETCILETLNPNVPKTCADIYEIPADATSLKLVVGDLNPFGSEEAQVDLGIQ